MPCSSVAYTVEVSLSLMYASFVRLVRGDTAYSSHVIVDSAAISIDEEAVRGVFKELLVLSSGYF
jgi:hypothetical protein